MQCDSSLPAIRQIEFTMHRAMLNKVDVLQFQKYTFCTRARGLTILYLSFFLKMSTFYFAPHPQQREMDFGKFGFASNIKNK